jgi:hypothetical protein
MNASVFKPQIWIVIGVSVASFLLHRHFLRPLVLESFSSGYLVIMVNSFPNFLEGIIGTITLSGLGLWFRNRGKNPSPENETAMFFNWMTIVAVAHVISQELNWYSITRENTYDPYDVVASILGLLVINRILNSVGLLTYTVDQRKTKLSKKVPNST